ncbi:uncharacterized protein LOC117123205 [Anneissia japonica]|uniref:uncharacterized protein LOC117123205 n=1 Tax=Anneissia japonica TaxID=1529436 RepID=UPI00142566F3|nr:uncharacterized protein LOC117123205 [Anneissia japonica]
MEYRHSKKNKLVQAILKENWEAVRSFLQTKPQLVNTYDEVDETPLIDAVWADAPDNVLEMMIDAATRENIKHEDSLHQTILHDLAMQGRVSALRRVLQKPNINVNGRDDKGRTPLHICLENKYSPYGEHREMAMCLMEHGALLIKDKKGKTPFDLYDRNKCGKYGGRSIRREKKEELKKLLLAMILPAQIKVRGKDAVTAFVNEIEKGEMTLVNNRVMFLGKEGAGKTSLVNSILGKQFNENEPSTCGILTTTAFQTVGEDYNKWEEHKDVDVYELTKQIREYNIAEGIARKLEPLEDQETTYMSVSSSPSESHLEPQPTSLTSEKKETSDVSQSAANVQFDRLPEEILKKVVANLDRQNPEPSRSAEEPKPGIFKRFFMKITRNKPTNKDARFERVVERVVENVPSDVACLWDYAGQISYYITHRFFLTDGSSYVVAFSLFEPLNELAKSRGPLKDQFEMTNLQMIIFWIRSIYEHAVLQYNVSTKLINDTIASPTISLVGTHKDKLEGSEEDKQNQIEAIFKIIFEEINGMPFEVHVDRTMYAVDNTSANDKGIEELKKNLGGYTKQMAKKVPTKWVDFQSKIQEVGKTTLRMSLDEVNEIAVNCGIPNENTIHILNYLNDCGIIMYSPTNIKLKNTVITNVHMLIEIFTKVITTEDQRPAVMASWHLLDKGILSEALLRRLWKHELEEDNSNFEVFIELMKVFGLLFEKQKESEEDDRTFIVPCLMSIVKDKNMEVEKDKKEMVSIYVTPTDFLPDAVYSVLVVAFVDLMKKKGRSDDAKLFRNRSDFDFDDDHLVSLGAVKIKNMHALKLEITHRIDEDANGEKVILEPHPSVCMEVLNYLKHQLKTVYGTTVGIGYELHVLCSVCHPTQPSHLHTLEKCLENNNVSCGKYKMNTSRFKVLFQEDIQDASLSKDLPHRPMFTDSTHGERMPGKSVDVVIVK